MHSQLRPFTRVHRHWSKLHASAMLSPFGTLPRFNNATRVTQPSEPILIPKLRIYFADFPYLRYSIGQRLFTLETCCGYGYEFARNLHTSLPIISRANASASDGTRPVPLFVVAHPISGQTDSRVFTLRFEPLNKKRQLSPKLALT